MKRPKAIEKAERIFFYNAGMLKTSDALGLGIHPKTLYELEKAGTIQKLSRGLYRLSALPGLSHPDLAIVSLRAPKAVLCLNSALAFHRLTSYAPDKIHLALKKGTEPPRISEPRVRLFWFSAFSYFEGIETHEIDGIPVRVYSPEKTIADCFKFRNKIGPEIAIQALKLYAQQNQIDLAELLRLAQLCRITRIIQPYLEAIF